MQNDATNSAKLPLHFIEAETQIRAELVRVGSSLGHHCEIYSDFSEIAIHPPRSGIIMVRDLPELGGIGMALDRLTNLGISLPIVAMDVDPSPGKVVRAVKEGALDYLVLPLRAERLAASLARIGHEAVHVSAMRQRMIYAQRKMAMLSQRENDVLQGLFDGNSNKEIARKLQISPRTVEIHRANMMTKFEARHPADAIRICIEAVGQKTEQRLSRAA